MRPGYDWHFALFNLCLMFGVWFLVLIGLFVSLVAENKDGEDRDAAVEARRKSLAAAP